jgi:hypothetical protein
VLGGTCVESGENLGEPLTPMVHIFIGVAGPNFGAGILCPSVVPNGPCDGTTGMSCGNLSFLSLIIQNRKFLFLDSKFLSDINLNSM